MNAVQYYAKHWDVFNDVITALDSNEAQSISECTELLKDAELPYSLAFIDANFSVIPSAIGKLETRGLSLKSAVELMENVQEKIKHMYDKSYAEKITSLLDRNPGYSILKEIVSLLSGNTKDTKNDFIQQISISDLTMFQYAPTVSCDVERVFSVYKTVLVDNRSFNFDNLKDHLVIKCNSHPNA